MTEVQAIQQRIDKVWAAACSGRMNASKARRELNKLHRELDGLDANIWDGMRLEEIHAYCLKRGDSRNTADRTVDAVCEYRIERAKRQRAAQDVGYAVQIDSAANDIFNHLPAELQSAILGV